MPRILDIFDQDGKVEEILAERKKPFSSSLQEPCKSKGMEEKKTKNPEVCGPAFISVSLKNFLIFFPRYNYSLSLTPTSYAAGASHNRAPLEMISFNSCDLSSPAELQPTFLCPRTYIMHRLHE